MKIITRQFYNYMDKMSKEMTYQEPFPTSTKCPKCKKLTKLLMLIDDDEGLLSHQRPKNVEIWPHDCTAIALYLCTNCGEMGVEWNQA